MELVGDCLFTRTYIVEKFAALDNTEKRKKFVFLQNLLK